jgi:hypothetical protein
MADGDIVHKHLSRFYRKLYECLCEGKASREESAGAVMKALKKNLQANGAGPIVLAQNISQKLDQIIGECNKNDAVNWANLNVEIERLVWQFNGPHRLKEIVLNAAKSFVRDLRYGVTIDIKNISEIIVQHYMHGVYESEFKERIPLIPEHHAGIDYVTLTRRIGEIQPDIDSVLEKWAKRANLDGHVKKLRLPLRPKMDKVDLDEDLCVAS